MNIDYTLWPNTDGNLGNKKVQIPDGVNVQWPDGDILVGNFVYKNGIVSAMVDTKALIANDSKTTTIPYDYFDVTFESIKEGDMTFIQGERCKYFTINYISGTSEPETPSYTELTNVRIGETQQINTQYIPSSEKLLYEIRCKINNEILVSDYIFYYKADRIFYGLSISRSGTKYDYACLINPGWISYNWGSSSPDITQMHTIKILESILSNEPGNISDYAIMSVDDTIFYTEVPFSFDLEEMWNNSFSLMNNLSPLYIGMGPEGSSTYDLTVEWFKIYNGSYNEEDLVCDMIPAQIENGTQGLFDKKRNIFLPIETITENAATYSLRNNSPTIEEIIRMIAEEKGISLES